MSLLLLVVVVVRFVLLTTVLVAVSTAVKHVKNSLISVRLMDEHTQRILNAQFEHVRDTWKCAGTHCRAEVSTWDNICPKCRRKRCFGPSNVKISSESWLCSV